MKHDELKIGSCVEVVWYDAVHAHYNDPEEAREDAKPELTVSAGYLFINTPQQVTLALHARVHLEKSAISFRNGPYLTIPRGMIRRIRLLK